MAGRISLLIDKEYNGGGHISSRMMKRIADGVTWKIHLYNKHLQSHPKTNT